MIRVAVVGTGGISVAHIAGLMTFPERCKIVALCDIYPEKAEALKQANGLDCEVFDDHEAMLAAGLDIDLVHVCTPPYVHAEIAINSMNAGCNVLVEKPMATCLAECDAMLEAEARNQVTMACVAQNRFRDSISKLKGVLDSGLVGKLNCAHINSYWWRGHNYYDLWWRGTWEKEGGGPTLNHAVHHIDMLNWMEGELPTEVNAMLTNVMHDNSEVEDLSLASALYRDGSLAQITSSVVHHGEEQGLVLQCADAKIAAPWDVKADIQIANGFWKEGGNKNLVDEINAYYEAIPALEHEGHTGQIENILTALETGEKTLITGIDGRNTVEVITAIYKAGIEKKTVSLPLDKTDAFYTFDGILRNAVRFHEKTGSIENFEEQDITLGNY